MEILQLKLKIKQNHNFFGVVCLGPGLAGMYVSGQWVVHV